MNISLEKQESIKSEFLISIPSSDIDKKFNKEINKAAKKAKIDGFRKGKIPTSLAKKYFGKDIRTDIISNKINEAVNKAVEENKLQALDVKVDFKENQEGKDLIFKLIIETNPKIELVDFSQIEILKPLINITEKEINKMIETLRTQLSTWKEVERSCEKGDQLTINFVGKIDGKEFEGGEAKNHKLVLGSGSMIPGFEDGIIGMVKGSNKNISVKFPEDYNAENLKGKDAEFFVEVNTIEEQELPEINEEFVQRIGVSDINNFSAEIESNMNRELKTAIKNSLKKQVFDGLLKIHNFEVPESFIKEEIKNEKQKFLQKMGDNAKNLDIGNLPDNIFQEKAKNSAKLGVILRKILEENKFEITDEKVDSMIDELSEVYEDKETFKEHFKKNEKELVNIKNSILEQELVDFVLSKAVITDKEEDFFSLIQKTYQEMQYA